MTDDNRISMTLFAISIIYLFFGANLGDFQYAMMVVVGMITILVVEIYWAITWERIGFFLAE